MIGGRSGCRGRVGVGTPVGLPFHEAAFFSDPECHSQYPCCLSHFAAICAAFSVSGGYVLSWNPRRLRPVADVPPHILRHQKPHAGRRLVLGDSLPSKNIVPESVLTELSAGRFRGSSVLRSHSGLHPVSFLRARGAARIHQTRQAMSPLESPVRNVAPRCWPMPASSAQHELLSQNIPKPPPRWR